MATGFSELLKLSKFFVLFQMFWIVHCAMVGDPDSMPRFLGPVTNSTAAIGKTASLTCRVENLRNYNLAWFHMDRKMLLTIKDTIVTRIPRFFVNSDDDSTWTLNINDVTRDDRGQYMCKINTEPTTSQSGYLDVVVPPVIVDEQSSGSSVVVQENHNVTLTCHAEGNPEPKISWVREDQKQITLNKRRKVMKHEGATLVLKKVSRRDMGAYLCIASNGVPPSVSKRIELKVQFAPIVLLPNQLMSAPMGKSVWLACRTEAFPRAVTFWKYKDSMVMSTHKYRLDEIIHDDYTTTVNLTINKLDKDDFGNYLCYSRNSFGENDGTVNLLELIQEETGHKMTKNIAEPDEINSIDNYPMEKEKGRGQNHLMLDLDESRNIGSDNNKMKNDITKGREQKSQLEQDFQGPNSIFTSIISGSYGTRMTPLHPLTASCVALSAYHLLIFR